MKHSSQLFTHYITVWVRLLQQASGAPDAATYLLTHDARTPLFYLEAMSRVLMKSDEDEKKMARLNVQFKALEDGLGMMDYYAGLLKDFKTVKLPEFKQHLETHLTIATAHMNTLLEKYGWINHEPSDKEAGSKVKENRTLANLNKTIQKIDWLSDKDLHQLLKKTYKSRITELKLQLKEPLKEIEQDVHELRRDVRWLSIYPQAFKGFVNLKASDPAPEAFAKYATDAIVQSPFNQLPQIEGMKYVLYMNTHAYYAMSWLIAELGELKDQGLRVLALTEWLEEHKKLSASQAEKAAVVILGKNQMNISQLLAKAREIVAQVRTDKIFAQLLV